MNYSGEAGPATASVIHVPHALARGRDTYYVSDAASRLVFSIDAKGVLRRFAGNGVLRALADGNQRLADAANAAGAGEVLVIYCNGLGLTNPAVTAGGAAPFSPLAVTANPVAVTIGGQLAAVAFAALAPGFTGLDQINAIVPAGIPPSGAAPVALIVAGQSSVSVTMGIR